MSGRCSSRIVLPLIRPALAALGILVFTFVWNDYFWALCLTQGDEAAPITVGVAALKGQWTTAWNLVVGGFDAGRVAFGADVLRDAEAFRRRPDVRCNQGLSACFAVNYLEETFSCNLVFVITRNNGPVRCGPTTQNAWSNSASRMCGSRNSRGAGWNRAPANSTGNGSTKPSRRWPLPG